VFQSSLCVGGARSHEATYEGPVDSVYLGCWNRQIFQRLGGFDERLIRNQDDEFSLRIVRSKGIVWQSPKIQSRYTPRNSLSALCRQYLQYGYWKVAVITKHGRTGSWRHLVPGAFVLSALSSGLAVACALMIPDMVTVWMILLLGTPIILYAAFCAISAAIVASARGWSLAPILPVVIASYHVSYGCGFLLGLIPKMGMKVHSKYLEKIFTGLTR
jgi:hypothetical protein